MLNKSVLYVNSQLIIIVLVVLFTACEQKQPKKKELSKQELIERGKFLVSVGGCEDCHSPKAFGPMGPQPDTTRSWSGHPAEMILPELNPALVQPGKWVLFTQDLTSAVGPWGITFSANITSDIETGIGSWQPEMFINAMRTGKHLGAGRPILPPMPWQAIGKLSDEDLTAIFYYLKSTKPVKNKVPEPIPLDQITATK